MQANWYLYRHVRLDKNEPFYIGIGQKEYFGRAFNVRQRNKIWKDIFAKTAIEVEIIFEALSKETAISKEIEFIKLYGRIDNGTGILANLTDGGEGSLNAIVSEAYRLRLSRQLTGSGNHMHNRKLTPEQKEKRLKNWLASNPKRSKEELSRLRERMKGNKFATHRFRVSRDDKVLTFDSASDCYKFLNISKATFGYYLSGYRIRGGVKVTEQYEDRVFNGYKIESAK